MSRSPQLRLRDILTACDAIEGHLQRGPRDDPLSDGMVYDAVRVRLIEIGEAVRSLDSLVRDREPDIAWGDIAGMLNRLAHRYFDTEHSIIAKTLRYDPPELREAVERLVPYYGSPPSSG